MDNFLNIPGLVFAKDSKSKTTAIDLFEKCVTGNAKNSRFTLSEAFIEESGFGTEKGFEVIALGDRVFITESPREEVAFKFKKELNEDGTFKGYKKQTSCKRTTSLIVDTLGVQVSKEKEEDNALNQYKVWTSEQPVILQEGQGVALYEILVEKPVQELAEEESATADVEPANMEEAVAEETAVAPVEELPQGAGSVGLSQSEPQSSNVNSDVFDLN